MDRAMHLFRSARMINAVLHFPYFSVSITAGSVAVYIGASVAQRSFAYLIEEHNTPVRVCDTCYEDLKQRGIESIDTDTSHLLSYERVISGLYAFF